MRSSLRSRRAARRTQRDTRPSEPAPGTARTVEAPPVDIQPNDPILAFFQNASGPVELDKLRLESPGLEALRAAGVKLAVPLVSQGELIGLLNLGPRLSEQDYSADDRKLLENLASQAAPAVRVAQLVKEQEAEIRTRERYQQELQIASLIQQNFLPSHAPEIAGWHLSAYYRSMREVGGDFYDFIDLPDGRVGIVIGDVTDKGVPAALVMASTRSVLRGAALSGRSPGYVLERVNDILGPDMPPKMFVTCLYAIFEPASGHIVYANAGHNVPYRRSVHAVDELMARGMPLGLMSGMEYEEREAVINPGETVLFTTDGIAEAHDADGEMFGCPRIIDLVGRHHRGSDLRDEVLASLQAFCGEDWEQEDDITMVILERTEYQASDFEVAPPLVMEDTPRVLDDFSLPSIEGNERLAMQHVADAVADLGLPTDKLEKLKTAVAEATMNAIEHGNENDPDKNVDIRVEATADTIRVTVVDLGGEREASPSVTPDLDLKLAGEQTPRGWGLFLIKSMVDELNVSTDGVHHTVELVLYLRGGE